MSSQGDSLAPAFAPFFGMVSVPADTNDFIANSSRAASPSQ
jgi:hypothetical protein